MSWDRYAYVNNNPINHTDSCGHCIDGLTTIPCLLILITVAGAAGGAAHYEFNISGNSWWESKEDAIGTGQAAIEGGLLSLGAGLTAGNIAAMIPEAAMWLGAKSNNVGLYSWGATEKGFLPQSTAGFNFRNAEFLQDHSDRHKAGLGYSTKEEYLEGARNLFKGGDGVETFVRSNGDSLFYNRNTNEFGILSSDGVIRTYYAPNRGLDYWLDQLNK